MHLFVSLRSSGALVAQRPTKICRLICKDVYNTTFRFSSNEVNPDVVDTSSKPSDITKIHLKMAARDYNNRRAAYNRRVSLLRKEYADMVAKQRAADKAEKEALARELTRRRLERQRQKNTRSAQNALRQEEMRLKQEEIFNDHLRNQQIIREEKNRRFNAARQLVVKELEEESKFWMTSAEEVEAAFTPEAEQRLWARRGGVLGVQNPSLDSHYWQFETHTWHMDKTYKTKRQVLLEEIENIAYEEANVDATYWTDDRLEKQIQLEEKARLRAMVRSAGRQVLLKKQKEMIDESVLSGNQDIPRLKPVPSMNVWTNDAALEREGAKVLMDDPTKFFVFESGLNAGESSSGNDLKYQGPALGRPLSLFDPLRHHSHQGTVFPVAVGKIPKPDKRSEREKKQQEREERMLAAAAQQQGVLDVDLAAEQQTIEDLGPDLDYDDNEWNSDDEEWVRGLNSETDADILNTPSEQRYTEEEIEWVLKTLDSKVKYHEQQFSVEVENLKQQMKTEIRQKADSSDLVDNDNLEALLLLLTEKEIMALSDLDDLYSSGLSDSEFANSLSEIPSLSKEQVLMILNRDRP